LRLTSCSPSVSLLSELRGYLNISEARSPTRPITEIALRFGITLISIRLETEIGFADVFDSYFRKRSKNLVFILVP
jgi:hypothetical protein